MEQIFDFLFSNFYFVIILIYMVYAMFFRKSPLEKRENRPGRQQVQRPEGQPAQRPGGGPAPRPHSRPGSRPAPSGRMPDFGELPVFPPKPARSLRPKPEPVRAEEEHPWVGRRMPGPELREPEWIPETSEPFPVPVHSMPGPTDVPDTPTDRGRLDLALSSDAGGLPGSSRSDSLRSDRSMSDLSRSAPAFAAVSAPAGERSEGISLSGDDLVRAVVWSEILGPPRARRPFRK